MVQKQDWKDPIVKGAKILRWPNDAPYVTIQNRIQDLQDARTPELRSLEDSCWDSKMMIFEFIYRSWYQKGHIGEAFIQI